MIKTRISRYKIFAVIAVSAAFLCEEPVIAADQWKNSGSQSSTTWSSPIKVQQWPSSTSSSAQKNSNQWSKSGQKYVSLAKKPPDWSSSTPKYQSLPEPDPAYSPVDPKNTDPMYARMVCAFDQEYNSFLAKRVNQNLAGDFEFYYLRQELQALVDMYRATGNNAYLEQAKKRAQKAITDATANPKALLYQNQTRGTYPCFLLEKNLGETGGHDQIIDFQGAQGLLMVAVLLKENGLDGWREIADFVERNIIEKWLYYYPGSKKEDLTGSKWKQNLLSVIQSARDKREYMAMLSMDLKRLGYTSYAYGEWAKFLTDLYVGERASLDSMPPDAGSLAGKAPIDWGLIPQKDTEGYVWYFVPDWQKKLVSAIDTSHANRTIWLVTMARYEGLVDEDTVKGLIKTLKNQIWQEDKGPFYFTNIVDGTDYQIQGSTAGRKGNLWFGWNRLGAYDPELKDLFVAIAYDLTNGGPNIPNGAQNKAMDEAPLCFYAWAARLLSNNGKPTVFP